MSWPPVTKAKGARYDGRERERNEGREKRNKVHGTIKERGGEEEDMTQDLSSGQTNRSLLCTSYSFAGRSGDGAGGVDGV